MDSERSLPDLPNVDGVQVQPQHASLAQQGLQQSYALEFELGPTEHVSVLRFDPTRRKRE